MKHNPLACFISFLVSLSSFTFAQVPGFHRHDGFFLSMNIGTGSGPIELDASGDSTVLIRNINVTGPGAAFEFKIGFAAAENLLVSFDLNTRAISAPNMEIDGIRLSSSDNITAGDNSAGIGITYYFMPTNMFISGTLGTGRFTIQNKSANFKSDSEWGRAIHIKVGKEWWVSNNWGLGVAAGFGHVAADDKPDSSNPSYKGKLSSGKFFVLFNTTFN